MKPTWIIGIIAVVAIAMIVIIAVFLGFIPNPIAILNTDTPPASETCDFTEGQILDMIETIAGKELNNQQGIAFVRSMGMMACGTDQKTYTEIVDYYKTLYADDWFIITEQPNSGAGWGAYGIAWGNAANPAECTWVKSILTGGGTAVKQMYGYNTITITGEGTAITYVAFAAWLSAS